MNPTNQTAAFVVLEGLRLGNRFFTTHTPGQSEDKICRSAKGELWYRILGYADTPQEAREIIYGTKDPALLKAREEVALAGYLAEMAARIELAEIDL